MPTRTGTDRIVLSMMTSRATTAPGSRGSPYASAWTKTFCAVGRPDVTVTASRATPSSPGPHRPLSDEVVRVSDVVDASVIVIGLRRRTPVGKLLMGSTAQRILLDADRPALAVKPVTT